MLRSLLRLFARFLSALCDTLRVRLLESGLWGVLAAWLATARSTNNTPLIINILQVVDSLPLTLTILTSDVR